MLWMKYLGSFYKELLIWKLLMSERTDISEFWTFYVLTVSVYLLLLQFKIFFGLYCSEKNIILKVKAIVSVVVPDQFALRS